MFHDSDSDHKVGPLATKSHHKKTDIVSFDSISPAVIIPLEDLKHWPRAVNCPACHEVSITRVERKVCSGTHTVAACFFLCSIVGAPIPYFSKAFKNVEHFCCRCNRRLATFHFQSGTELHVF